MLDLIYWVSSSKFTLDRSVFSIDTNIGCWLGVRGDGLATIMSHEGDAMPVFVVAVGAMEVMALWLRLWPPWLG